MHRVGKVRIMKKLMKEPLLSCLLEPLYHNEPIKIGDAFDVIEFVRSVMYRGLKDESYRETRVRIYKNMNAKTLMSLPQIADPFSQS